MNTDSQIPPVLQTFRSPGLMNVNDTALLIIDVQEKLLPLVEGCEQIQWNIERLISGADVLGVKIVVTEQYPNGLGTTVAGIRDSLSAAGVDSSVEKTMFSCRECDTMISELLDAGVSKLLLTGIETHVCVAQSALDLIAAGFSVYVCVDAVGARGTLDHITAIRRLENAGAIPTTTEAALFEWCEKAGSNSFKKVSQLVKESDRRIGF